jgi:hypothetical protein
MRRGTLILLVLLFFVIPTSAQSDASVTIIGVRGDQLLMLADSSETLIDQSEYTIFPLQANSRGDVLYMNIEYSNEVHQLFVFDGFQSRLVTEEFSYQIPPYFFDDDHVIYVSNVTGDLVTNSSGESYFPADILNVDLTTDSAEKFGTYREYGGGGGGSSYAMDFVFFDETFSRGFGMVPAFFDAELYNPDRIGFAEILGVSPDRTRLLSLSRTNDDFTLEFIDVTTGDITEFMHFNASFSSAFWAPMA